MNKLKKHNKVRHSGPAAHATLTSSRACARRYMQREVMKILIILLLFFSWTISAKDLCPINEDVAEDMRIEESAFNKANAEKSADYLLKIVKDENTPFEWFSIPNATKFIHGYALRRKALATNATKLTIDQFCDFYAKEGWYYD